MINLLLSVGYAVLMASLFPAAAISTFERDTITTSAGNVEITFIGHGTLMFRWKDKTIHVDPYGKLADYQSLPKADLILVTHHHGDHLDPEAIDKVRTDKTRILLTALSVEKIKGTVMRNGDKQNVHGIVVEAVPAYNILRKRPDGSPFHPKGEGNGYVVTIGRTRIYIAGDTENTTEMKALKDIDVAFLPMNLPYTMTPDQVADAAKAFKPKILYPYHFGETDLSLLRGLMKDAGGIEMRIRNMK